ncbi:RNA polymerase I subunit [Planoprotostelium fungivorum]|uniref:DNA-directed RNA polymerase subunit n=1 Tax=Planoprotostelium fungivorum TaxID=1890364 RepID=A0A2P6NCQ4_9EUKA|nr:RNA polymerase I subunit [Planoprotostelium fungivorum]
MADWKSVFTLKLKADFCPQCGTLLDLPSGPSISCDLCKYTVQTKELSSLQSTSRKAQEKRMEDQEEEDNTDARATILETCPKCHHERAYFRTAQTRSADEGQTIFYECCQCGNNWTHNS